MNKKFYLFVCVYAFAMAVPLIFWIYPNFWDWMASSPEDIAGRTFGAFAFAIIVMAVLYGAGVFMNTMLPENIYNANEIQALAQAKKELVDAERSLRFERDRGR